MSWLNTHITDITGHTEKYVQNIYLTKKRIQSRNKLEYVRRPYFLTLETTWWITSKYIEWMHFFLSIQDAIHIITIYYIGG